MGRWTAALSVAWVAAQVATPPPSLAAGASCPSTGDEAVTVAAVETRLDLRLADGRRLRLVGVDPPSDTPSRPDLADTVRHEAETLAAGRAASLRLLAGKPDRWGRLPASLYVEDGAGHSANLAETLVSAGLARYLAEPSAHACRDALLAAEAAARTARRGLWQDAFYTVLGADDRAAFVERSATVVVAEGTLTKVEAGPYRTKLRFAARGRWDVLAATILPRTLKLFEEQGVELQSLVGRRLRVRGLLDLRFGPQIELTSPDALEILPPAPVHAPTPTSSVADHG